MRRRLLFALLLMAGLMPAGFANAAPDLTQLAQAQPAQAPAAAPQTPAAPATQTPATPAPDPAAPAADAAPEEPIGSVATVTGKATVTRDDKTIPLKVKDDIYLNDVVQTAASSSLGLTFSDGTTFNLKANAQITIDTFVYEDGGKQNAGVFDVAKGTVAFVAAAVAKTGDMKITTPTATLGIRGTSGLVEVPAGASAATTNNVNVKLYPDADGRVGRIEVNDRAGAQLGFLTQGSSGFAIRPGAGGVRFAAVPITITAQMIARDTGFVRQVHSMQLVGRRVFDEQRAFRRANPGFVNPNRPIRQPGQQPGQFRRNGLPGQHGSPDRTVRDNSSSRDCGRASSNRARLTGRVCSSGRVRRSRADNCRGRVSPARPDRGRCRVSPVSRHCPPCKTGADSSNRDCRHGRGSRSRPACPASPDKRDLRQGRPARRSRGCRRRANCRSTAKPIAGSTAKPAASSAAKSATSAQPPVPQQGGGQFRQGGVPGAPGLQRPGLSGRPALQLPRRQAPAVVPAPRGKKQRDVR